MDNVRRSVDFPNYYTVSLVGKRSGLTLMWKDDIKLEIFNYSCSHINAIVWDFG